MLKNSELTNLKKTLINQDITFENESYPYSISCYYHDIHINIYSPELEFITDIEKLIPKSWVTEERAQIDIFFLSPERFKVTQEIWSNEPEQDCHIEDTIVIQRDFAAKRIGNRLNTITHLRVADGFHNFLRWFLPRELMLINNYVLHSACVLGRDGRANFFLGHSGAGKSTISSLSEDRAVLGDDMNLIINKNSRYQAMAGAIGGLFFHGASYDTAYEIANCYWIEQSHRNKTTRLSIPQAITKLTASVTNLFWENLTEEEIAKIFEFNIGLANSIPFYSLEFKKDSSFWNIIEE